VEIPLCGDVGAGTGGCASGCWSSLGTVPAARLVSAQFRSTTPRGPHNRTIFRTALSKCA